MAAERVTGGGISDIYHRDYELPKWIYYSLIVIQCYLFIVFVIICNRAFMLVDSQAEVCFLSFIAVVVLFISLLEQ